MLCKIVGDKCTFESGSSAVDPSAYVVKKFMYISAEHDKLSVFEDQAAGLCLKRLFQRRASDAAHNEF